MQRKYRRSQRLRRLMSMGVGLAVAAAMPAVSHGAASVSAYDAANFRVWAYIPYWASQTQISNFATNGMYTHVSDVLHFGGLRPNANGDLAWAAGSYQTAFNTLRSQMQTSGFKLHLSMFEVTEGSTQTDATWLSIIGDPVKRANFVTQLTDVLDGSSGTADDLAGFNFDWERPVSATDWGNYTQLARELRNVINPLGMDVSVCDYGSTDSDWDATSSFDAKVYDQLMMMVYHLSATSSGNWANTKLALTQQGSAKAFSDNQIGIGVGTWGDGVGSAPTVTLDQIFAASPNLAYDALSFTGTIGSTTNGTWNIESRKQVREKTQLAIDRGMPGMFSWTLHYDSTGQKGLHRVMHHYMVVKKDIPDMNLDGNVDATDATNLANNMGAVLTNTGTAAGVAFDNFYMNGNWESGDRDGNGFVNQLDADWLAGRYTALGVALPDRLAYSGTFESFSNSQGLTGRWRAGRDGSNKLKETSNFKQEAANFVSWNGTGAGASQRSNNFITVRNQNAAETTAVINGATRNLNADLTTAINLSQQNETYFSFVVKENTGALSAAQLASPNRTLSLEFLDAAGVAEYDFTLLGLEQKFAIRSLADGAGQDVSLAGFTSNAAYLLVGKIVGNGTGANTLYASLFPNGAVVGDFTSPSFSWMLAATGGAGFNPTITDIQFTIPSQANYTVSNVWINAVVPEPTGALLIVAGLAGLSGRRRRD